MKRLGVYILVVVMLAVSSCQVVREEDCYLLVPNPTAEKNVLLVEFSGLTCLNCPSAAEKANKLLNAYGENLVVVEMHPATSPFTKTTKSEYDYTCAEADEYFLHFGGSSSTSFPTGVVNFSKADDEAYFVDYDNWATNIEKYAKGTPAVDVSVVPTVEDDNLKLNVVLGNHMATEEVVTLLLWVTEDSIVGAQYMPDSTGNLGYNFEYIHNHLLRGAIGGTWGSEYTVAPNGVQSLNFEYQLLPKWKVENCSIVAVLLDEEKEVVNVTKKEL